MTKSQAQWASKHDWYASQCIHNNGNITVYVRNVVSIELVPGVYVTEEQETQSFTDYQKLRDWAGY